MLRAQTERMIRRLPVWVWGCAASIVWLALNLISLERFPTVFIDEAENGIHAYNAAFHGHSVFTLYDDLFPKSLTFQRQAWPPAIRPIFVWSLAAFLKGTTFSLFRARGFSLMLGFGCLLLTYWAGVTLRGRAWGFVSVAILGTYFPFLYSSHSIRPEIFLGFDGIAIFLALLWGLQTDQPGAWGLAGILTGLAPGIHTNGLALVVPVSVVLLGQHRWRGTLWVFLGWVTGTLIFVRLAAWEQFVPGYRALFFNEFGAPPIFSEQGHLLRIVIRELDRYFGAWIFHHWTGGLLFSKLLSVQHVVLAVIVLWGCFQEAEERLVAIFTVGLAMAYAFLVGQKASNYLTALAPFLALTAAGWFLRDGLPRLGAHEPVDTSAAIQAGLRWSGFLVLVTSGFGAVLMAASICFYRPSFSTLARQFSARLPPTSRVAGPQALWLGLPSYDYRDIGALVWHRLLLNEKNLWRPLEAWRPDYVILENQMVRRFAQLAREAHHPAMRGPTGILPWPHEVLDVVQTGPAYGDSMALIHIDWPKRASR